MSKTTIKMRKNGPFVIEGELELLDSRGEAFGLGERERILLCSCGASKNPPFCDSSHHRETRDWDPEARQLP